MEKDLFGQRIRLRHLHCFVAIAQVQHLGKAAEKLRLSQPAVSKTLLELESLLDARLVERGRFGARLTREGQTFLTHAVAVLDGLNAAQRALNTGKPHAFESVSVGVLPTVAPDLLPAVLAGYRAEHPQTRVQVQTAPNTILLERLKAGDLDFVLGRMADPQMMAGISFELLYVDPLAFIARPGHPLGLTTHPAMADIIGFPLIVSPLGTAPRHSAQSLLQSRGLVMPENCIETLSISFARLTVLESDAVWLVPYGAVRHDLEQGHLSRLAVDTSGTEEPVGMLRRSDATAGHGANSLMKMIVHAADIRRPHSAASPLFSKEA